MTEKPRYMTEIFGDDLHNPDRFFYPHKNVDAHTYERFARIRETGAKIIVVDGAFDVPQPAHHWYLRDARMSTELGRCENDTILQHIGKGAVHLAVTLDADHKIARKKGAKKEKGGSVRPVYGWEARAGQLANYHFMNGDTITHTVDTITVEGDPMHEGTVLNSTLELCTFLHTYDLLDCYVVYGEHGKAVEDARAHDLPIRVIPETNVYAINPQTGKEWHSSDIINTIRNGEQATHPLTYPPHTV